MLLDLLQSCNPRASLVQGRPGNFQLPVGMQFKNLGVVAVNHSCDGPEQRLDKKRSCRREAARRCLSLKP